MNAILDLTLAGNDLPPGPIEEEHVIQIARQLEDRLIDQGRSWRDVSLLLLLNSKQVVDDSGEDADSNGEAGIDEDVITDLQQKSDEKLVAGLRAFCSERG